MPDAILTPWYVFGKGEQRGRTDSNYNAEVMPVLGGYHWLVSHLDASSRRPVRMVGGSTVAFGLPSMGGKNAIRRGAVPFGEMTKEEALDKAKADATKALLEAE